MLDGFMRKWINPPLLRSGEILARAGITPNQVTFAGLVLGLASAGLIALGAPLLALIPLALSRVADGLDGAVAQATRRTGLGGYYDIVADFLFYGAIPMAFVWADPAKNGAAGAFLLLSFYVNGTCFLGYAIMAERHGMKTDVQGKKTIYFSPGLIEGTETIICLILMCFLSSHFAIIAWIFGALCFATAFNRVRATIDMFRDSDRGDETPVAPPNTPSSVEHSN